MSHLYEIASKAEYIQDLIHSIESGNATAKMPQYLIDDIYSQLCNIADTINEYHDWKLDDD